MYTTLIVLLATAGFGMLVGQLTPGLFENGANSARGRVVGLRDGALIGLTILEALHIGDLWSAGATWNLVTTAVAIVGITALICISESGSFFTIDKVLRNYFRAPFWAASAMAVGNLAAVIGYDTAIMLACLGWLIGLLTGGFLSGGALMDLLGSRQNYTGPSARYGAAAAVISVAALTTAFGELSTVATVVCSVVPAAAAGFLTAFAKYAAEKRI